MPGLPSAGSGDMPGTPAPAPGTVSLPAPQPGSPAAGASAASAPAQAGTGQQPGAATSTGAGAREQTEDEILAEALEALERRPAPGQQGEDSAGQGAEGGGPAVTDAEKKQALGEELEQGFAEFDRVMLSEQQANNERADQEGGGGFTGDDAFAGADDLTDGSAAEPLQTALVDSDPISVKGEGNIPTPSHSRVPPDLADARDDDIIARQLREAAMKEQDPELREKLWDEYRKYKRDSR